MQARGPLMIEHRLIERMLALIKDILEKIEAERSLDPAFLDAAIDFMRVYADRTHHGKEEDILFRELKNKPLSPADRQAMEELIKDHAFGRQLIKAIVDDNTRYRNGDQTVLTGLATKLETLLGFYPGHIEKEDKVFFPASRSYFTEEEEQALLAEFRDFDSKLIHEKYRSVVEKLKTDIESQES